MTDQRSITTLQLSPSLIGLLISSGFKTASDILELGPLDLSREIKVSLDVARDIFQSISKTSPETLLNNNNNNNNNDNTPNSSTPNNSISPNNSSISIGSNALDLLIKCSEERPVITFCREIDRALGGGIASGQVTEICGVPGIGKTQIGIQLALDVQIPAALKGREGEAIYIDTEGSFLVERVAGMAQSLASHLTQIAATAPPGSAKSRCVEHITRDSLLKGIHYFRALDQTELLAIIHHLSAFLTNHPKVKLVVIDSIAFHFRQDLQNISSRNRTLSTIAQKLNKCATENNYPSIVVMNHVTTKIDKATGRNSLCPALGDHWSHSITNRLILQWKGDQRMAYLVKSPNRPKARAPFAVTSLGIRDINSSSNHQHVPQISISSSSNNNSNNTSGNNNNNNNNNSSNNNNNSGNNNDQQQDKRQRIR